MPNEINITVRSKDKSQLDKLGAEGKRAGKEVADGIQRGFKDAEQSADRSISSIRDSMRSNLGDAGRDGAASLIDSFTGAGVGSRLAESMTSGKAGIAGAGLALGGLLLKGITDAVEQGKVGAAIVAATGQGTEAAERMGRIAGGLFADSFGESVADAGRALTAVFQEGLIDPSASDAAIAELTGKILTVSSTVEEEAQKVSRSARTMVVNGVARNVSDALDIIQRSTEKGINTAGDLLDTIDEYSVQFARAGLSGQEAMGLISQALQGGARDADIAADAIKEFNIRAQDGTATTARGFQTLGLDSEKMSNMMARGGKSAHEALRMTLNALQAMPPGVARSTAAVDLFGTKAEDMGDALFDMDLDTAVDEFGNYKGAVDDASQALGDSIPVWEQWAKNAQQLLSDVGTAFLGLRDAMDAGVDAFSGVPGGMDAVRQAEAGLGSQTEETTGAQEKQAEQTERGTGVIETQIESLDKWIAKQQEAAGVVLDVRDSEREYQEALDGITESLRENGKTHDDNTEAGRANNEALDDLAKSALDHAAAMEKDGRSVMDVNKHMGTARTAFIRAARQMGYSAEEATNLANKLKLIPNKVSVSIAVRDAAARHNIDMFNRALARIPRTITVSTYVRGANINASAGSGHMFYESGGVTSSAQTGGARGPSTVVNEAGPELIRTPNGSNVMTAGATRAMAEAGLLQLDGIVGPFGVTEFAQSGGARGRGVPAYQRTGQVSIREGQHSPQFIQNLLDRGWRMMGGDEDTLYSPWRQSRAGAARRFSSGRVAASGHGSGVLVDPARSQPLAGAFSGGMPKLEVSGDADSAVAVMINQLIRDNKIKLVKRS